RLGGSEDRPALCMPTWSFDRQGAAIDLQSYVTTISGCLQFDESLFFLDCCRVEQVAPKGQGSDHECGAPNKSGRQEMAAYAADIFRQGFEGQVNGEIRGYFTSALLETLQQGRISLFDLQTKLDRLVPLKSKNRQKPRFDGNI